MESGDTFSLTCWYELVKVIKSCDTISLTCCYEKFYKISWTFSLTFDLIKFMKSRDTISLTCWYEKVYKISWHILFNMLLWDVLLFTLVAGWLVALHAKRKLLPLLSIENMLELYSYSQTSYGDIVDKNTITITIYREYVRAVLVFTNIIWRYCS